jgi:hypothetical protein
VPQSPSDHPDPTCLFKEEWQKVFSSHPTETEILPLLHNPVNAVTTGVWRVRCGPQSAVVKILSGPDRTTGLWAASDDPRHWNYWRREALVYEGGLHRLWEAHGILGPGLLASFDRDEDSIALWLEDVEGPPATGWPIAMHGLHAERLGAAHAAQIASGQVDRSWLSRGFVRGYLASKQLGWELLDDDEAWQQPAVRDHFPDGLRAAMIRLHLDREWFLDVLERLPRVFSHLDMWPANVLSRGTESIVVDWSFAGDGALGEDIGNYIPDTMFDLFLPTARLPDLQAAVYGGYLRGLRQSNWQGDERLVRLGVCASAVKYDWLAAQMLARAADAHQPAYGRRATVAVADRYRERGLALAFLAGWAQEARGLAVQLGFPTPPTGLRP